jgi:hypothetical protein
MSLKSRMKKVLKRFMEKWTDGLYRWLFDAQPTKEEVWPSARSGCES